MKFLHTSDWHLGARLSEFSRLPEQKAVLEELRGVAEGSGADFIIIAGDIFDNFNPPNEAVELLYRELKKLADDGRRPVIVIAGNHDSPDRIEAPDPLAAECGIFFIGYPDFIRPDVKLESGVCADFPEKGIIRLKIPDRPEVRIITTPYANENRLRKFLGAGNQDQALSEVISGRWTELADRYCDESGINILTAHLFMADTASVGELFAAADSAGEEPEEERSILHPGGLELIDASLVPDQIQYTALGHLHRPQLIREIPSPVVYSGSPIAFGLSEQNQAKSAVIVSVEPGKPAGLEFPGLSSGRRILRKIFSGVDEAVRWLNDNPGCFAELVIECDRFISADDRSRLTAAHDGITAIIPQSRNEADGGSSSKSSLQVPDLSGSMEELFRSYFEFSRGMPPDEDIVTLFREVAAVDGDNDET